MHFDDLDDLFAAAGARQAEEVAHLLYAVDADLPLPERIDAVVEQRAAIWEVLAPVRRAALLWASSSKTLQAGNERMTRRAIRDLDRVFGTELDRWGDRRDVALEALHVASSAGAWEVLRNERGLTVERRASAVARDVTVTTLLPARPDETRR